MKFRNVWYFFAALLLTIALSACSDNEKAKPEATTAPSTTPSTAATTPAVEDPLKGTVITGTILETLDAGGYTYVHLDRGTEKSWIAMPGAAVNVGDEISVIYSMAMPNFESKTLERTFTNLIFASGFAGDAPPAMATQVSTPPDPGAGGSSFAEAMRSESNAPMMPQGAVPPGSSKSVVPLDENIHVEKATGDNAYTVGEIYANSASLDGKKVLVKAKVVKVLPNIMGRNWLHLQDGSGDPSLKTHDLVVTTSELAQQGDIVIVEGVMAANKDFGSGYSYTALVEDAVISR